MDTKFPFLPFSLRFYYQYSCNTLPCGRTLPLFNEMKEKIPELLKFAVLVVRVGPGIWAPLILLLVTPLILVVELLNPIDYVALPPL